LSRAGRHRPKYEQTDDERPRHHSNKKTGRWCKGKPGVEHELRWQLDKRWMFNKSRRHHKVCVNCQKFEWRESFYITCIETEGDLEHVLKKMQGKFGFFW